ncbi:MAG: putative gamma-glutamyltransferase YwrD [Firmicutes bacterium]|nr:putative gamma-glutamyltransferase YwrD [candidate division NPL-UPA2 bacterium]
MVYDPLYYPFRSQRMCMYAERGMVATGHPLAAQAGLDTLKRGGNAVDAAIATAACLTVVEPTANGIGSDAFALVWAEGALHGLNASGPAPNTISREALAAQGLAEMPRFGLTPVTVPGAPGAWAALSARFGRLPLPTVLAPAIEYAGRGFPLSPTLGRGWKSALTQDLKDLTAPVHQAYLDTFAPSGRPPAVGEVWRSPDHAKTLASIAETRAESFYRGELAERIDRFSREHGGYIRGEDLASYYPEWVTPLAVNYRGFDVWELPPNGQGLVALLALNILTGYEFAERDNVETYHRQIEAVKLAFADGLAHITDPRCMSVMPAELLSMEYATKRRGEIGQAALTPTTGTPIRGGTVYLATADGEGNMVSYIQSNYMGFGARVVVPGTGISLQNRGHSFSLDSAHANVLSPGKRPFHTIIPGFLTQAGAAIGPFGIMGGHMQPQAHVQVLMNLLDFNLNPQAALDAPRWQWVSGKTVQVEPSFPQHIAEALMRRGHAVQRTVDVGGFGRGQVIWRDGATRVLCGGTEPRTDGHIAVW